jgi:hypothetical protein
MDDRADVRLAQRKRELSRSRGWSPAPYFSAEHSRSRSGSLDERARRSDPTRAKPFLSVAAATSAASSSGAWSRRARR